MRYVCTRVSFVCLLFLVFLIPQAIFATEPLTFDNFSSVVRLIEKEYVDFVDRFVLITGAKKELLGACKENVVLRSNVSLNDHLAAAASLDDLRRVYNECLILVGVDQGQYLMYAMLRGAVHALKDPHSVFFSPEECVRFRDALSGRVQGGVGVMLRFHRASGYFMISDVLPNTPASRAGLLSRDLILEINSVDIKNKDARIILGMIRGDIGTEVKFTIKRNEKNVFRVTMVRTEIHAPSVMCHIIKDVAHIKIYYFGDKTADRELDIMLNDLDTKDIKGYVLDVRNNGGGYISAAVHMVGKFVASDKPVTWILTRLTDIDLYLSGIAEAYFTSGRQARIRPLVVLQNEYSASASEMLAGALQDYGYKIVGTKSYGKGSMQIIFELSDGSAVKMTIARWLTPFRHPVDHVGIKPDIEVQNNEKSDGDVQLERAVQEVLNTK